MADGGGRWAEEAVGEEGRKAMSCRRPHSPIGLEFAHSVEHDGADGRRTGKRADNAENVKIWMKSGG
jgi:hypothetical protein